MTNLGHRFVFRIALTFATSKPKVWELIKQKYDAHERRLKGQRGIPYSLAKDLLIEAVLMENPKLSREDGAMIIDHLTIDYRGVPNQRSGARLGSDFYRSKRVQEVKKHTGARK